MKAILIQEVTVKEQTAYYCGVIVVACEKWIRICKLLIAYLLNGWRENRYVRLFRGLEKQLPFT